MQETDFPRPLEGDEGGMELALCLVLRDETGQEINSLPVSGSAKAEGLQQGSSEV